MSEVRIVEFNDPNCPFGFSAEPHRLRLLWLFGDQITWVHHVVVLAESREEYAKKGLTPELIQGGNTQLAERYGMPFELSLRDAVPATIEACRAIVAARLHGGAGAEDRLTRALRRWNFDGRGLLDEPETIRGAAADAGLDADALVGWMAGQDVEDALREDMRLARTPNESALALDHKLAPWSGGRRYTCPSYEITGGDMTVTAPGMQPMESYEVALAHVAPGLTRREDATDVADVLAWAPYPLATQEVAALLNVSRDAAREQLVAAGAVEAPVGTDAYWSAAS